MIKIPYIKKEKRAKIDGVVDALAHVIEDLGDVNYAISRLVHKLILREKLGYAVLNSLIGVLECAKLELYRMVIGPYENKKRMENGPVSDLDAKSLEDIR